MTDIAMGLDRDEAASVMSVLFAEITAGVAVFDADHGLRAASPMLRTMLGLPAALTRTGARLAAILDHAVAAGLLTATPDTLVLFGAAHPGEAPDEVPADVLPPGGVVPWTGSAGRHLELTVRPLAGGMHLALWRDITQQERDRAALNEERSRTQHMLRHVTDAIVLLDPGGVILENSDRSGRLLGAPPELVVPGATHQGILRFFYRRGDYGFDTPEDEFVQQRRAAILAAGTLTFTTPMPAGTWVEYNFHPMPNRNMLVIIRDVTALKTRETELRTALDHQAALAAESARLREEQEAGYQALSRERALLQSVVDHVSDGIIVCESDLDVVLSNEAIAELNGVPDNAGFRNLRDAFRWQFEHGHLPRSHATIEQDVEAHAIQFRTGQPFTRTGQRANGKWIRSEWKPLPDGKWLMIHVDVTETMRRERELREARDALEQEGERLRAILDNLPDGVALAAADGELMHMNAASRELNFPGLTDFRQIRTMRDAMGWQLRNAEQPPGYDEIEAMLDQRMATFYRTGDSRREILRFGRYLDIRWIPLPGGRRLILHRDITELRESEIELRQAHEATEHAYGLMRDVLDGMLDGVSLYGEAGEALFGNRAFHRVNGIPADLLTTLTTLEAGIRWQLENGEASGPHDDIEANVRAAMARFWSREPRQWVRQAKDGRWIDVHWLPLPGGRMLALHRDITALKQQEARLALERDAAETARAEAEAANQAKSTFLAAMSHEIRTPMNGVLGMMELLERTDLSGEQQRHVGIMRDSAQSLLRIIDDLLDFSKIDAGRMDLETLPFSLHGLIAGTVDSFAPRARQQGLALFADPPGPGPDWLAGDPTRVRQILFNLIGNALKFTERGFVRVSAVTTREAGMAPGSAQVTLTVEDSGIGMDDAQRARLFQPFSQADSSTTRRFGGTGLGLSIVRRLAELMGGTAVVESKPGRGSRFIVTLRFAIAAAAASEPAAPVVSRIASGTDKPKLLVADDHPVNREVIQQQLTVLGLAADLAADGREALELWRRRRHGVVLLDIHMPELDGFDVARAIRREEVAAGLARTGLIAVTANAIKGEDERCFAAGMDGFVAKPISLDALTRALGRFVPGLGDFGGAVATGGGAAFDPETLRGLFGPDPARLSRLFETFVEAATVDLATLRVAGSAAERAGPAHRLKGAARMVGARMLAEQASRVEEAARAGDADAADAAAEGLAGMLAETVRAARASFGMAERQAAESA